MSDKLAIYTVYKHPKDYPDDFIVRRFIIDSGIPVPDEEVFMYAKTVEEIHDRFVRAGKFFINRYEDDDPKIIGVYL